MEDTNVELNKENLVEYLRDDDTFVEYFNTFLSLPCFQTRIYYDKQSGLLEEFTQKLVKDDCGNIQKRHDPTRNEVQISYCVTVLDHQSTLKWLQKYRLDEFVRSMIFAEYKLSKALSSAQANYFERITGNISRGKTFITEMKTCGISSKESFNSHLDDQFRSTSSSSTEKQSYKSNDKTSGDIIAGADVRTIDVREDVYGASNDEVLTSNVSGNSNKGKGFDEEEKSKNEHSDDFVVLKNDELVKKRNDGDCFLQNTTSSLDSLQYNGISVESDQKINDNDANRKALLSSKTAMDKFKDFLVDTKGESLLLLWLQIEYWKHIKNSEERKRYVQEMKQQYGSPLELPRKIKKDMLSGLAEDMNEAQKIVEEPLLNYWCKRFTLHEVNISKKVHSSSKMSPSILICTPIHISPYPTNAQYIPRPQSYKTPQSLNTQYIHRPHSYKTAQSLNAQDIHGPQSYKTPQSLNAQYIPRPQSYNTPQSRIVSYSSISSHWESNISLQHVSRTCNKWKPTHLRSKSARGRKVTTPYHTNAGKRQLEIYATPEKEEFGFKKRPISAFPRCSDVEYFSPIRLVIAPRIAPSLSTVLEQRWYDVMDDARGQQSRDSVEEDETYDVERSLRDSLEYQTESGCFLKDFILKENNKFWSNCLSFWQATRDYSACFESGPFCSETVICKAKWIYERFLAPGSVCDINVSSNVRENIKKQLDPPYENLFDDVDDHVLTCLKEPWDSLCRAERKEYEMIPKSEQLRYITVKLNDNNSRRKISLLSNELDDQEGKENFESGRYGVEDVENSLPVPPDGVSLESLMKDREELEGFQRFLEKRDPKGKMDLMAWTDMETFQRMPRNVQEKRNKKAKEIGHAYLNSRYFFGPDSPATKQAQSVILSMNGAHRIQERPSSSVIVECQKYVRCRIERLWLLMYKKSNEYKERQNPKPKISDVVEDMMLRRRLQKSEATWRILNSRWVSSSRDIVALRQTLNNPELCIAFRKFVALKGETYENDILFWIEIQKYKDLCHRHASEDCVKKKVQAITDCFITSSIPPELQVDVPIEMAEKLMERITCRNPNIGPYLFREVQITVFRVLFNMWKEYISFRNSMDGDNLLEILEERLQRHRVETKAKRDAQERKKIAKMEADKKKKEKEEKEKRELRSMDQLVNLMADNNSTQWEGDENDVLIWKYSQHITSVMVELTNERSVATKSTNQIARRLISEKPTLKQSNTSASYTSLARTTNHSERNVKRQENISNDDTRLPEGRRSKLSKNRDKEKSKQIFINNELLFLPNAPTENGVSRRLDPGNKGCQSSKKDDTDSVENMKFKVQETREMSRDGELRTKLLQKKLNNNNKRLGSPVPLTSQLLEDFTNSPQGSPLDRTVSLVEINGPQDIALTKLDDGKVKAMPKIITKRTTLMQFRKRALKPEVLKTDVSIPDVIVN